MREREGRHRKYRDETLFTFVMIDPTTKINEQLGPVRIFRVAWLKYVSLSSKFLSPSVTIEMTLTDCFYTKAYLFYYPFLASVSLDQEPFQNTLS